MSVATTRRAAARVAFLSVLSVAAVPALGQTNDVFDQFFRYTETAHKTFIEGVGNESVDPFTGTLRIVQTDLVLPGKAGLNVELTRSYSSKIWVRTDGVGLDRFIGYSEPPMIGWGWSFHMGRLKNPTGDGGSSRPCADYCSSLTPCSMRYPVLELPDGSSRVFYLENLPPGGAPGTMVSHDRWRLQQNCPLAGGTGVCIWSPDGVRREYMPENAFPYRDRAKTVGWPMSRMVDRFGNTISVSYESDKLGAVSTIVDTYQRQVTFRYTGTGYDKRLDTVTAGANVYRYGYTAVSTGFGLARMLTSVTPPSGRPYAYEYAMNVPAAQNQYALSRITYPYGGTVSYLYAGQTFYMGGAAPTIPVVYRRTVGGTGVTSGAWNYAYTAGSTGWNTTTVTRPDGRGGTTTDLYSMYGYGQLRSMPAGNLWRLGLTKTISRSGGAEIEDRTWKASPAVASVLFAAPACNGVSITDPAVVEPLVESRVVTRKTGTSTTDTYTTQYQRYDTLGRVESLVESGPAGQGGTTSRTTSLTYFTDPTLNMVKGFPLSKQVCIGTDCVTDSWTYAGPSNAMDSETRSGIKTTFGYHLGDPEGRGNLKTVTNALGQTLTLTGYGPSAGNQYGGGVPLTVDFNGAIGFNRTTTWEGWLLSQTDRRNNMTSYKVDGIGRVIEVTPPGGNDPTTTVHDQAATGGWNSVATRGTYVLTTTFDGFGRTIRTSDSLGVKTSAMYDVLGRQWFKAYPYSSTTEVGEKYDLDDLGRVTLLSKGCSGASSPALACSGTDLSTVSYTYGANNCVTVAEQRNPDTLTTVRCYDAFGAPEQERLTYLKDAATNVWRYAHTAAGQLKSVTAPDARGNRTYTYDATQFMTSEKAAELGIISGDSVSVRYTPNELSQVKTRTDARGVTSTYGYADPLSRLTSVTYSSDPASSVSRSYQAGSNNLSSVSSARGGAYSYPTWDELDRLRAQTWTFGGSTYTTNYVYDTHGCLTQIQYPTGSTVNQTCDALGRVKTIGIDGTLLVSDVIYDPSGQVAQVSYPGSRSRTNTFDTRGRMKTATTAGFPASVVGLSYTYDGTDNITTLNNVNGFSLRMCATPSGDCSGGYDALNRLVMVMAPSRWGSAGYSYDALGNRTFKTADQPSPTNTTYTYDSSNRLSAASDGTTFTWDAAGNLASTSGASPKTLTWDAAGKLATSSDGASYQYDGLGRRVSKTVAGVTTVFHHDSAGMVIAETTSSGLRRSYVYLGGKLVAAKGCLTDGVTTCSELQWYHTDALGSVLAYTDASGNVLERFEYGPWGESWSVSDPSRAGDRQYNGRVYDKGTGFHDYGARMYWPEIGRFVSADSYRGDVANPASLNLFSYVHDNPYKYTDPTGHWCVPCVLFIVGMIAGESYAGYQSYKADPSAKHMTGDMLYGQALGGLAGITAGEAIEVAAGGAALWRAKQSFDAMKSAPAAQAEASAAAKNPALAAEAVAARDALAAELAGQRHPPATVVGAYSSSTGQVTAGASRGGGLGCAEGVCSQKLGSPADIQFTPAVRPRTGQTVPVCQNCEATYGRGAFPGDAVFKSDQKR